MVGVADRERQLESQQSLAALRPVLDPTLRMGLQAILSAASAWLCAPAGGTAIR
jgi:hypothetical protein